MNRIDRNAAESYRAALRLRLCRALQLRPGLLLPAAGVDPYAETAWCRAGASGTSSRGWAG